MKECKEVAEKQGSEEWAFASFVEEAIRTKQLKRGPDGHYVAA